MLFILSIGIGFRSGDLHCIADRILSVVWYEPENVIITGGVDCIRVWSLNSGQAVARLDMGRIAAQANTFVYALCVTEYVADYNNNHNIVICYAVVTYSFILLLFIE